MNRTKPSETKLDLEGKTYTYNTNRTDGHKQPKPNQNPVVQVLKSWSRSNMCLYVLNAELRASHYFGINLLNTAEVLFS